MSKKAIITDADEVLTVTEASVLLKVGQSAVYKLASCGMIPARKVGREWRFHKNGLTGVVERAG